jgi:hypothetical protein
MHTQLWKPWSIFDELERTVFVAAGSQEWPEKAKPRRIKLATGAVEKVKGLLSHDKADLQPAA